MEMDQDPKINTNRTPEKIITGRSVEVTVEGVNIGNDCTKEQDEICLVIKVNFKNIFAELNRIDYGIILVISDQKEYVFGKAPADQELNWEMQLNPQESKTIDILYIIPFELNGDIYFNPENFKSGERIYLGNYNNGKLNVK